MWRIHLCGELRVEYGGTRREAQLRGRQGRLAFAYLLLHRDRAVRRDALIEALWADEGAPPTAKAEKKIARASRGRRMGSQAGKELTPEELEKLLRVG